MTVEIKTQDQLSSEKAEEVTSVEETTVVDETVEDELDSEGTDEWGDLAEDSDEETHAEADPDIEPDTEGDVDAEAEPEGTSEDEEPTGEEEAKTEEESEPEAKDVIVETPEDETTPESNEEFVARTTEARSKAMEELENKFQLSEEQADELISDPNKVLPKMMAGLFLEVYENIMGGLRQQLPNMVTQTMTSANDARQSQNKFYNAWPQLNKAEYHETVTRIAKNYQAMNPGVSQEAALKEVGAQAWVALRLPLDELLAHTQGDAQVTEVAEVSRAPAGTGGASRQGQAPDQPLVNDFTQLADELLLEDD